MPSTAIRNARYDPERRELNVEFVTGRRYTYFDVPEPVAQGFQQAFSKGRYFNAHVRDRFRFIELEPV